MISDILGFSMEAMGAPWGPHGDPMGTPWGRMGTHGDPWVPMGSHGFPWVPMGPHGSPCVPMGPHGSSSLEFLPTARVARPLMANTHFITECFRILSFWSVSSRTQASIFDAYLFQQPSQKQNNLTARVSASPKQSMIVQNIAKRRNSF